MTKQALALFRSSGKDELGWADFHVRSDRAIRRLQRLVNCAFSILLGPMVRPTRAPGRHRTGLLPRRRAGEGAQPYPTSPNGLAGPGPYGPSAPGSPSPSPSPDGGEPGRTPTHPPNSRP